MHCTKVEAGTPTVPPIWTFVAETNYWHDIHRENENYLHMSHRTGMRTFALPCQAIVFTKLMKFEMLTQKVHIEVPTFRDRVTREVIWIGWYPWSSQLALADSCGRMPKIIHFFYFLLVPDGTTSWMSAMFVRCGIEGNRPSGQRCLSIHWLTEWPITRNIWYTHFKALAFHWTPFFWRVRWCATL